MDFSRWLLPTLCSWFVAIAPCMADEFAQSVAPLLAEHCHSCHGEKKQKGGIELHHVRTREEAFQYHRFLKNVATQIRTGEMPPEDDVDQLPTAEERKKMVAGIEKVLSQLRLGDFPRSPGRPTIRRLNRTEYSNTVRDLFGVNFQAGKDFPTDGAAGEGFDNVGDSLFIPPVLMEKYFQASKRVVDAVYANDALKKRILFRNPEEQQDPLVAAKIVINRHASLAFRRRLEEDDLKRLLALFEQGIKKGKKSTTPCAPRCRHC